MNDRFSDFHTRILYRRVLVYIARYQRCTNFNIPNHTPIINMVHLVI